MTPAKTATPPRQHHIRIDDQDIAYTIQRSARKTLGFVVGQHGLEVRASTHLPLAEIEAALYRHSRWILKKLQSRIQNPPQPLLDLVDGLRLPFMGKDLLLRINPTDDLSRAIAHWENESELHLKLPKKADIVHVLEQVLRHRATKEFTPRLEHYCRMLDAKRPPLRISSARTRWGSASQRSVCLNWRLLHFPVEIIDHVIAHEVAHLREANHGPRFYEVLTQLDPHHRAHHEKLRALTRTLPTWTKKTIQTSEEHL